MNLRILVVDDDPIILKGICKSIDSFGHYDYAYSSHEAINLLNNNFYHLVITDMQMEQDDSGLAVVKHAKSFGVYTIVLSSSQSNELIEKSYTYGAKHFLKKKFYSNYLPEILENFQRKNQVQDIHRLYPTQDEQLISHLDYISSMPPNSQSFFIQGETGVGKSKLAITIHKILNISKAPFIHINCSEFNESLLESELFGHEKGSFTGALSDKIGKLSLADGGTLFLDELGTMPISMQKKLLLAIESKEFYPIGSSKKMKSNFRLISATNQNIEKLIQEDKFREDLYYRINGINLTIKPLRQRINDIPLIIHSLMANSPRNIIIKEEAMELIKKYPWPGNIRELKKFIEMLVSQNAGIIDQKIIENKLILKSNKETPLNDSILNFVKNHGLRQYFQEVEKFVAKEILKSHNNKVTPTIKTLKISNSAFYRILEKNPEILAK